MKKFQIGDACPVSNARHLGKGDDMGIAGQTDTGDGCEIDNTCLICTYIC